MTNVFEELLYPPNDPQFKYQKKLFEALYIKETWKAVRESGLPRRDVIVTVIDTGVDTEYPDLEGKLLKGEDASGSWWPSVEDMSGHGTRVTSIIAAGINNRIGMAGIADRVKIRPIRLHVSPDGTTTSQQIMTAWTIANRFKDSDVVVYATSGPCDHELSLMFKRLINKAVEQGNFVVVTADNSDDSGGPDEIHIPCSMANPTPGVVCVAATLTSTPTILSRNASLLASFGVPGTELIAPVYSKEDNQWRYMKKHGSSYATAIVGGIAALMQSFKKFKPNEMKEILLNSTEGKVITNEGVEMLYGVLRPDIAVKRAIALAA